MAHVELDGLRVHYRWAGGESGPVLVFVNGLLTDLSSWAGHTPRFENYRCLIWDCRGQGKTDKPEQPAYTIADHARDLGDLLDALELREPVALIGLSNGGATALRFCADQPERVAALVLSGAYARADKALELKLRSWIAAMKIGGGGLRFDVATPWVWGSRFLSANWESLLAYRDKGLALDVGAAERLIRGATEQSLSTEALAKIRCPTLVTVGEEDLLTPPYLSREIASAVPLARFEILEGLGHAAALEDDEGFCRIARRFLDAALQT